MSGSEEMREIKGPRRKDEGVSLHTFGGERVNRSAVSRDGGACKLFALQPASEYEESARASESRTWLQIKCRLNEEGMTERGSDCSFIMPPICSPEQKHKQEGARKHTAKASARFRAQTERHETLCVTEALNMTQAL